MESGILVNARLVRSTGNMGGSLSGSLVFRFVRACGSCQTSHALNDLSEGTRVTEVPAFAYVSDSKLDRITENWYNNYGVTDAKTL